MGRKPERRVWPSMTSSHRHFHASKKRIALTAGPPRTKSVCFSRKPRMSRGRPYALPPTGVFFRRQRIPNRLNSSTYGPMPISTAKILKPATLPTNACPNSCMSEMQMPATAMKPKLIIKAFPREPGCSIIRKRPSRPSENGIQKITLKTEASLALWHERQSVFLFENGSRSVLKNAWFSDSSPHLSHFIRRSVWSKNHSNPAFACCMSAGEG